MESGVLGDFEMDCGIFGWGFGNSAVWGFSVVGGFIVVMGEHSVVVYDV